MKNITSPFPEIKKSRKRIFATKMLLKSTLYALAILGFIFVVLLLSVVGVLNKDKISIRQLPSKIALNLDFNSVYTEIKPDDLLVEISGIQTMSYYDLIKTINFAAKDERVKVIVADISDVGLGLSQVQNVRKAIKEFRKSGKKAIAYSTGFGSFGGGTKSYYLASSFDEIWVQPNVEVGLTGISVEVPFFKEVFEKFGVEPEFYTRYEYKSAASSFMDKKFTKEHKFELTKMVDSIFSQIVLDISEDRSLEIKELKNIINNAPLYISNEADNKLVDFVDYRPNLIDKIYKENDSKLVDMSEYVLHTNEIEFKGGSSVAFLVLEGSIEDGGNSRPNPLGDGIINSGFVIEQLEKIQKNKNIKSLVVRINSPGGSYSASNEIWYAINYVKEKMKIPVVISMSDYAASGGYFIALSGDYIFAEPSTITGSIGVLGGKMVLAGMWEKLGVNWEAVSAGKNAGSLSFNRKFSDSEKIVFNKSLDNIYKDFVGKVSESRKIGLEDMDKIARGRVWTGLQARDNGLVDEIGGIHEAINKAKELAEISDDEFNVIYYPNKKTIKEKISEVMSGGIRRVDSKVMFNTIGVDLRDLELLKRFKYDAMLAPFKLSM